MKTLFLACVALVCLGCAPKTPIIIDPDARPVYGMSKKDLWDMMGRPNAIEIYKQTNEALKEFDIYLRPDNGNTAKVPVCIVNGKVAGWGNTYYSDHVYDDDLRMK